MTIVNYPHQLGKYRIDALLGQGGMGTVYRAFDAEIDREVAIKILHSHLLTGEKGAELTERFIREAKAAARCQHPNTITIYDQGLIENDRYIVMEYVKGVDLKGLLASKQMIPLEKAINITLVVLKTLHNVHQKGVIHRDIKPANIMLLDDGEVKVTDFGVAHITNSTLTGIGAVPGTLMYMPPEAQSGESITPRADIYATALVLLELLTNKRPVNKLFDYDSLVAELASRNFSPKFVKKMANVLAKALEKDPQQSYTTALDFANALATCLDLSDIEMPYNEKLEDFQKHTHKKWSEEELFILLNPLLDELASLHKGQRLHRDIGLDTIFFSETGKPGFIESDETKLAVSCYAPFEYCVGAEKSQIGPWSDIYSLAAVFYELIGGEKPHPATNRALQDKMPSLKQRVLQLAQSNQLTDKFSPAFIAAMDAALGVRTEKRPRSVEEWRGMMTKNTSIVKQKQGLITILSLVTLIIGGGLVYKFSTQKPIEIVKTNPVPTPEPPKPISTPELPKLVPKPEIAKVPPIEQKPTPVVIAPPALKPEIAKAEMEAKAAADAKAKADAEAKVVAESKAKEEAKATVAADVKAKVDAQAKAKVEAEAKAAKEKAEKAEAEAKIKTAVENKAKADAQAKADAIAAQKPPEVVATPTPPPQPPKVSKDDLFKQATAFYDKKQYVAALPLLKQAADLGHSEAQYKLGVMYERGQGTKKSLTQAVVFYEKAAQQGLDNAQYNLAVLYLSRFKKDKEGVDWLKKAANQKDPDAERALGFLYEKGLHGIVKDSAKAKELYELAKQDTHK